MIPAQRGSTVCFWKYSPYLYDQLCFQPSPAFSVTCVQAGAVPDAFQVEAERLQELMQDKGELLLRVQTLRKVKGYQVSTVLQPTCPTYAQGNYCCVCDLSLLHDLGIV